MKTKDGKTVMISQLKDGVKFTVVGLDGVYIRVPSFINIRNKKAGKRQPARRGSCAYLKEGNKDLFYYADKPVLKVLEY